MTALVFHRQKDDMTAPVIMGLRKSAFRFHWRIDAPSLALYTVSALPALAQSPHKTTDVSPAATDSPDGYAVDDGSAFTLHGEDEYGWQ
jgi:hypothetical protein